MSDHAGIVELETKNAALHAQIAQLRKERKEWKERAEVAEKRFAAREREFKELMQRLWSRGEDAQGKPMAPGTPAPAEVGVPLPVVDQVQR